MDKLNFSFGILIAYFIPGFILLYALEPFSNTVNVLLHGNGGVPDAASLFPVSVLSLACGMVVNALTAATLRKVFEGFGARPPSPADMARLKNAQLEVHKRVIENSYRYFECYSNMTTALFVLFLSSTVNRFFPVALGTRMEGKR